MMFTFQDWEIVWHGLMIAESASSSFPPRASRYLGWGSALQPINSAVVIFTRPHNPAGIHLSALFQVWNSYFLAVWIYLTMLIKVKLFWPGFSRLSFGNVRGCDTFKSEFRTVVRCLVLRYACSGGVVWFNEFVERDCRMGALLTADWLHLSLFATNGCHQGRDGCSGIFHWTLSLACGCVPLQAIFFP